MKKERPRVTDLGQTDKEWGEGEEVKPTDCDINKDKYM